MALCFSALGFSALGFSALGLSACSSALSTLPSDTPQEDTAPTTAASEASGPAGFFACDDLTDCKAKCDKGLWDGCAGAYVRSDRSTPERDTAAKQFLEKGCALGGDLACTMLEPNDPPVGKGGPKQIATLGTDQR